MILDNIVAGSCTNFFLFELNQIYNEKIYDILSASDTTAASSSMTSPRRGVKDGSVTHRAGWNCVKAAKEAPSLAMRQKLDGSVFVDGLTSRNLSSRDEMLQAFREVACLEKGCCYRSQLIMVGLSN